MKRGRVDLIEAFQEQKTAAMRERNLMKGLQKVQNQWRKTMKGWDWEEKRRSKRRRRRYCIMKIETNLMYHFVYHHGIDFARILVVLE